MANTYKALSTVTVGAGGTSSISFTNIPQTYTDLVIRVSSRATTTNNYIFTVNDLNGVSRGIFATVGTVNGSSDTIMYGLTLSNNFAANYYSNDESVFTNYASNVATKAIGYSGTQESALAGAGNMYQYLLYGYHVPTIRPITKITIVPTSTHTFNQYTTATLYGVFNADVSSAPATPTIGTATASAGAASITFTGVSNAASYTMTSTPGSITGTGTHSPIIVSGLTNGTSYTFKVKSNNPFGSSAESAASNSVTPSSSFESIATTSVGAGGASSIVFSGIPSDYTHLQIRYIARNTSSNTDPASINLQMNGDTGSNYNTHYIFGSGAGPGGSLGELWTQIATIGTSSITNLGCSVGASATNCVGMGIIDIVDYANTNKLKTVRAFGGTSFNVGDPRDKNRSGFGSGLWRSTSAITSLTFTTTNNFAQYTHFALYGIRS